MSLKRMVDNLEFWRDRVLNHHSGWKDTLDAQNRHIMCELGEAMREYADWNGDNPRRPDGLPEAQRRYRDELADVVITAMITIDVLENGYHFVNTKESETALAIVMERLEFVTNRMQRYDDVNNHV